MELVLDTYALPHDLDVPVVAMDEQPIQLTQETRKPLAVRPGDPACFDFEYERCGTANIFIFTSPLNCWRRVAATSSRKRTDWAEQIRLLLEEDFPDARKVILVCDNLNTHAISSLYAAFPAAHAHELARRLEIRYTPKHGSWLNVAECELSALSRQCLGIRMGSLEDLAARVEPWATERNASQIGIVWQFTTADARIKLTNLYPVILKKTEY